MTLQVPSKYNRGHPYLVPSLIFNRNFELKTKNILGTLRDPVRDRFDLILANPPYVTSGSSNLKDEIAKNGEAQ